MKQIFIILKQTYLLSFTKKIKITKELMLNKAGALSKRKYLMLGYLVTF